MYVFSPPGQRPLDTTSYADPGPTDRTGPPLSRGGLFVLLSTVASEDLSPAMNAALRALDPELWYHGQLLEDALGELEAKDPALPELLGRNIHFMFRTQLEHAGVKSATDLVAGIAGVWAFATRGDSGTWRSTMKGERHALLEAEQPYNCLFEAGALRGFIEAFDGHDVRIEHAKCRRQGHAFCAFEARWSE